MDVTEKLLFFNKDGYPYNFTYTNSIWNGKIFFDANGTDTFQNLGMYVLEKVDPIHYEDNLQIVNSELYNNSGMTITPFTYSDITVSNIKPVNQSPSFYTKWVEGDNIDSKFPTSTIVSFSGVTINELSTDKLYTVLGTKKNAVMISTSTPNDSFASGTTSGMTINSNRTISFSEYGNDLQTAYFPGYDMKLSVVGTVSNDGVYEISKTGKTYTSIYDYELSGITTGSTIDLNITYLTERPLLYSGDVEIYNQGTTDYIKFIKGKNSNFNVGDTFMVEDVDGNHLYNSSEYTILSFVGELSLGTTGITLSEKREIDDNGKLNISTIITFPKTLDINEQDTIYLNKSGSNNNNQKRIVTVIENSTKSGYYDATLGSVLSVSGITIPSGLTSYIIDGNFSTGVTISNSVTTPYQITKVLKEHQKNIATVSQTLSYYGSTSNVRCLSTSNIVKYNHTIISGSTLSGGTMDSIDTFILKYKQPLSNNGIDLYRKNTKLVVEGMYYGQNHYFTSDLKVNNNSLASLNSYSDASGVTSVYNICVKDNQLISERYNMSFGTSNVFSADITFDLADDAQDYGFNINVQNTDYYIAFNNTSGDISGMTYGKTAGTKLTITSFIDKWYSIFLKNGLLLSQGTLVDSTLDHLYITGVEPNVDITVFSVRVNKNSRYNLDKTDNKYMMVSSNYITSGSTSVDFIDKEFTTGMVLSLHGSNNPSNNKEYNIIGLSSDKIELSFQGAMYSDSAYLSLQTREYLRRPRESNLKDIYYRFRWEDDSMDSMFMYDLSGDNLIPWKNNIDYTYTGPKPLPINGDMVYLNKDTNSDLSLVSSPSAQQTIFNELNFKLDKKTADYVSVLPKPITLFLGYNTQEEGTQKRNLIIERVDNVSYSGMTSSTMLVKMENNKVTITNGLDLLDLGFEYGRKIRMTFNSTDVYSTNRFDNWNDFTVIDVTKTTFVIEGDLKYFNTTGQTFNFTIEQLSEQIGFISLYGETEAEDERLVSNLKMVGVDLTSEDEFIFQESNIKEHGIDYKLLNNKRKEMMNVYPEIYNYIGSYTSIFKSMYFFGYSDIQLIEYYKNIDTNSPLYNSLKRIVIPDLFDRSVEGWSYSEDLSTKIGYKKTNLLNLTYKITDEDGNNVNFFSLEEVQIKLNGLKNWLRKHIIPVNSNIRDITGVSEVKGTIWRQFDASNNIIKHKTIESSDSIGFNYICSKNFNDSWLVSVRFYNVNDFTPDYFDLKVITYVKDSNGMLQPQQYYKVFKTDMLPFNFYMNWGDVITDQYIHIETTYMNERGVGRTVKKMYNLEDGVTYYFDEFKNYTLINNNFEYKYPLYTQNMENVYIMDDDGNIYIIRK